LLDVKVDEFTLVLHPVKRPQFIEDWEHIALNIIEKTLVLTNIETVLGYLVESDTSIPAGYSQGLVTDKPYHFAIAFHQDYIQMGVCLKFSAYAWSEYQKLYYEIFDKSINIHQFLQKLETYTKINSRLSRIDIAIDFINENLDVDFIYNKIVREKHIVRNASGRKNNSNISAITKNNITNTFYIGARVKNYRVLLRIYDKKKEQIETYGVEYNKALQYDNWVRFEAVFKSKYAHLLTKHLLEIKNDLELKNLLVSAVIDRYQFHYVKSNNLTDYSKKINSLLYQKNFNFSIPSPRNNLLDRSISHLLNGAGLFSTLWKVQEIWDEDTAQELMNYLYTMYYDTFTPNEDHLSWINKYKHYYLLTGKPWKLKK